MIVDPPNCAEQPEAILVNKQDSLDLAVVSRVTIQDLAIEVRNVYVVYTGPTPKPEQLDGIATALGTSGLIQDCIVDGIPKVGIHVAEGFHAVYVDRCEVHNTDGAVGQVRISLSGCDRVVISNSHSHDNTSAGLLVGVNGPIEGRPPVPATTVQVIGGRYQRYGRMAFVWATASDIANALRHAFLPKAG